MSHSPYWTCAVPDAMNGYNHVNAIAYRADIDGLRAIAIVPVVLYHAGIAPFGGGFVGVDVFFVISGYLITSFILARLGQGTFSLGDFYLRRIRRIFPALCFMMTACVSVGLLVLTPNGLKSLGESILGTVLFSSNVLFWRETGYFVQPLEAQPLLHTWSLGVEEQFYLFFPLLLAMIWSFFPRRVVTVTAALCALSLAFNLLTVTSAPRFAFYMAPARVWELFIGSLLAMGALTPPRSPRWSEAAGLFGAGLIAIAVFEFSKETTFPGIAALVPTLGAAAIIWAGTGKGGVVTRLLSRREPVFVGKTSYSFYLWHFPLLSFAAYVNGGTIGQTGAWTVVGISAVVAIVSWFYIEQPVRAGRWVFGNSRLVFRTAAAALVLFGGFGLAVVATDGFPARIGEPGLRLLAGENDVNPDRVRCLPLADPADIIRPPGCRFGADDVPVTYAIWGDSHGESLRGGIDRAARRAKRAGVFLGYAGCIPELGIERDNPGCSAGNEAIAKYLTSMPSIQTVVLAGRWGLWAEGEPYGAEGGRRVTMTTTAGVSLDNHTALASGLNAAMASLHAAGKKIWLVGPIPEIGRSVPRTLYLKSRGFLAGVDIQPTVAQFKSRQKFVLPLLARLADKYGAQLIWPHHLLCGARFCDIQQHGRPLYSDDQHLARSAAVSLSSIFDPMFVGSPIARVNANP